MNEHDIHRAARGDRVAAREQAEMLDKEGKTLTEKDSALLKGISSFVEHNDLN